MKSTNLIQNAVKNQVTFCHQSGSVSRKTPGRRPEYYRSEKKPLGKLAVAVDIETLEAIRFELCMSGALD